MEENWELKSRVLPQLPSASRNEMGEEEEEEDEWVVMMAVCWGLEDALWREERLNREGVWVRAGNESNRSGDTSVQNSQMVVHLFIIQIKKPHNSLFFSSESGDRLN